MEEESEGPKRHPYHPHALLKTDTRRIYAKYEARWKCDICGKSYDGRSEDDEQRYAYHCTQCRPPDYFDACIKCFRGHLHSFHTHRLQPARPSLCYPQTNGHWRCDGCQRVFGGLTDQISYHCQKCKIDLCRECFQGEWFHVLHSNGEHPLVPVDPRIQYRCYESWSCDVCNRVGTHGSTNWLLFHCKQCQEDICFSCYQGHTHYLHPHGLVLRERTQSRRDTTTTYCSACSRQLLGKTFYSCRDPNCSFYLCTNCFQTPARPHPLHPAHPLFMSNPEQVYPESGGVWHCDNCTNTHPLKKATPLTSASHMYHCDTCQFDLCHTCYKKGSSNSDIAPPIPWNPPPPSAPLLSQHHNYFSSKEQYKRPLVSRPSVNFIPSPSSSLPAPSICRICGLAAARLSPTHGGKPHSEPLYCQECAKHVLDSREVCFKCSLVPDGMVMV